MAISPMMSYVEREAASYTSMTLVFSGAFSAGGYFANGTEKVGSVQSS